MSSILATELPQPAEARVPIYALRWGAIFAGLAVGLSIHLLLMLLGAAGGLTAVDVREGAPDATQSALIAAVWNTAAMLVAAFIGGYVAARASGLKRTTDGLLHGVVAWGATTLLTAVLATSAIGSAVGGAFSALRPMVQEIATQSAVALPGVRTAPGNPAGAGAQGVSGAPADQLRDQLASGRRDEAVATLRDRFGLSDEQAARVADGLGSASGNPAVAAGNATSDPRVRQQAAEAADTASKALWWLVGSVILSLLAGLAGGALGVRTAANRHRQRRERAAAVVAEPVAHHHVIRPDLQPDAARYSSDPRARPDPIVRR